MRYPSSVSFVTSCVFATVSIAATGASPQEINELIAQLASPNASPGKVDEVADEFPPGFDRAAQARVFKAWRQLYDLGITAFPYLIKSIGDKRYCFTMDEGSADVNSSVGRACLDIVRCHLQPYGTFTVGEGSPLARSVRPQYVVQFNLIDYKSAAKWWGARKEKSMQELQIEVLEWVIAKEEKDSKKYSKKEIAYLSDILTNLRKAKMPLKPAWPFSR